MKFKHSYSKKWGKWIIQDTAEKYQTLRVDNETDAIRIEGYLRTVTNAIEKDTLRPLQRSHDELLDALKGTGQNLLKIAEANKLGG